ncbi:MAG: hypothetical protein ACRDKX_00950, partial [Solirubrobacterales bacterium]
MAVDREPGVGLGSEAALSAPVAWGRTLARHRPAIAGYALPFLLILYLALEGGGYDPIVRGEVGIAVWWIVLLGAVAGVLPAARVSKAGLVMLA